MITTCIMTSCSIYSEVVYNISLNNRAAGTGGASTWGGGRPGVAAYRGVDQTLNREVPSPLGTPVMFMYCRLTAGGCILTLRALVSAKVVFKFMRFDKHM